MAKFKKIIDVVLVVLIFAITGSIVYINIQKQQAVDRSKIPEKVEMNKGFQRWITNLKNKGLTIEADEFKLLEENEIYNTKWLKIYSMDQEGVTELFEQAIASHQDIKKVIFSPSKRQFIDYRSEERDGYNANEVHYYGLREDKVVDARILDCSAKANCMFDRAYFLDNDVFVISEISRNIDKKAVDAPPCTPNNKCTYSFKLHVIDLNRNSRLIYESKPFETILTGLIPDL